MAPCSRPTATEEMPCNIHPVTPLAISRPGWATGARAIANWRSSAGSPSSSPRSSSARRSARRRSTRATTTPSDRPHRADQILKHGGFKQSGPLTEIAVVQSKHLTIANPAVPGGDRRRGADRRSHVERPQPALAARPGKPRPGLARRAHRARRMGHERQAQGRREADRPADRGGRLGRRPAPRRSTSARPAR